MTKTETLADLRLVAATVFVLSWVGVLTYVLGLSVVDYLMFNVVLSGLVLALGTIVVVRRVHRDNDAAHRRAMRSIRGRS